MSSTTKKYGAHMPTRILVADDEHLMATGIASGIEALGMEVIGPASDGRRAIELARSSSVDLAILDIRMPEVDGLTAAETLWSEMDVPSVIVSAFSDESYVKRAQETGVFSYLLKPVTTEHLRAAVSVAWARAKTVAESGDRISQLEKTLENRRLVEQAKWRLIEAESISEQEAHSRLQRRARNERRSIAEVAREVLGLPEEAAS